MIAVPPDSETSQLFDVVIIGAGVAGSVAACELARLGRRVAIIERSRFPRFKVCGGCVNQRAASVFDSLGITRESLAAEPLTNLSVGCGSQRIRLPFAEGYAVSRTRLDDALLSRAKELGAIVFSETRAEPEPPDCGTDRRTVTLHTPSGKQSVTASVVLAGSGLLSDRTAQQEGIRVQIRPGSRIGMGAIIPGDRADYESGTIHMAVGRGGYLGLARVEEGQLNMAAAIDSEWLRTFDSPGEALASLLQTANFPVTPEMIAAEWRGTPELTRRADRLGGHRLFLIGDACGYVEPFTGEGMAWSATGSQSIAPLVCKGIERWSDDLVTRWETVHRSLVSRRQRVCRSVAGLLRRPGLTAGALRMLTLWPNLSRPLFRHINTPAAEAVETE